MRGNQLQERPCVDGTHSNATHSLVSSSLLYQGDERDKRAHWRCALAGLRENYFCNCSLERENILPYEINWTNTSQVLRVWTQFKLSRKATVIKYKVWWLYHDLHFPRIHHCRRHSFCCSNINFIRWPQNNFPTWRGGIPHQNIETNEAFPRNAPKYIPSSARIVAKTIPLSGRNLLPTKYEHGGYKTTQINISRANVESSFQSLAQKLPKWSANWRSMRGREITASLFFSSEMLAKLLKGFKIFNDKHFMLLKTKEE